MPKLKETRRIRTVPAKKTSEKNVLEFTAPTRKMKVGSPVRVVARTTMPTSHQRGVRFTYGMGKVKKSSDNNVKVFVSGGIDDNLTYEIEVPVYDGSYTIEKVKR